MYLFQDFLFFDSWYSSISSPHAKESKTTAFLPLIVFSVGLMDFLDTFHFFSQLLTPLVPPPILFCSKNNSSSCTLFHTLSLYGKWSFIWEYVPVQMSVERVRCSQKQKLEEGINRYSRKWKREEEIICICSFVWDPFVSVFLDLVDLWCWTCRSDFIWIVIKPIHVFLSRSLRDADWTLIWCDVGDRKAEHW